MYTLLPRRRSILKSYSLIDFSIAIIGWYYLFHLTDPLFLLVAKFSSQLSQNYKILCNIAVFLNFIEITKKIPGLFREVTYAIDTPLLYSTLIQVLFPYFCFLSHAYIRRRSSAFNRFHLKDAVRLKQHYYFQCKGIFNYQHVHINKPYFSKI